MSNKKEIVNRIMRLEKELADAEIELQNSNESSSIYDEDLVSGMIFCPPPGGIQQPVMIMYNVSKSEYAIGGRNGDPLESWDRTFTKSELKAWLTSKKYEKSGPLTTNFSLMKHSSETPF